MAVLIGQASISENETIYGNTGDQSGREINISNWYSFPWDVYLVCTDSSIANRAATYMEQIAQNANYGYSQANRWDGYNSIRANGGNVSSGRGDFDCSSLVISCYALAGLQITVGSGYTGTIENTMKSTGKFLVFRDSKYLTNPAYGVRGAIYLNTRDHVCMCLSNGAYASQVVGEKNTQPQPAQKENQPQVTPITELKYKIGDVVNFTGDFHYSSAYTNNGAPCSSGIARITSALKGVAHPYHLIKTSGSKSSVYGWVNESQIESVITSTASQPTAGSQIEFIKEVQSILGQLATGQSTQILLDKTITLSTSQNCTHKLVKPLQKYLISLGYSLPKYGADGEFGEETKQAVMKFQKSFYGNSLDADGEVTARCLTWAKLLGIK